MRLASRGFDVAVIDWDRTLDAETARLVEATGRKALFVRADVWDAADVARDVETTEETLGPIAALANNAGIEGVVAPITDYPDETFDQVIAVNTRGVFLGLKYVLRRMVARGRVPWSTRRPPRPSADAPASPPTSRPSMPCSG